MSQDKQKLMMILHNLEEDYKSGNISEEKYIYLSNQYKHKIETIDVTDRIRVMQGKSKPHSLYPQNEDLEDNDFEQKSREEDERLIKKFIYDPKNNSSKNEKNKNKESKPTNKWAYGALATVLLLIAFGAGIGFGVFNIGDSLGSTNALAGVTASINDTAFPIVTANTTKNVSSNITTTTNKTYSSTSDNNVSSNTDNNYGDYNSTPPSGSGSGGSGSGGSGSSSGSGSDGSGSSSGSGSGGSGSSSGSSSGQ